MQDASHIWNTFENLRNVFDMFSKWLRETVEVCSMRVRAVSGYRPARARHGFELGHSTMVWCDTNEAGNAHVLVSTKYIELCVRVLPAKQMELQHTLQLLHCNMHRLVSCTPSNQPTPSGPSQSTCGSPAVDAQPTCTQMQITKRQAAVDTYAHMQPSEKRQAALSPNDKHKWLLESLGCCSRQPRSMLECGLCLLQGTADDLVDVLLPMTSTNGCRCMPGGDVQRPVANRSRC